MYIDIHVFVNNIDRLNEMKLKKQTIRNRRRGYVKVVPWRIYYVKFKVWLSILLSRLVYNFNKIVPGVRVDKNMKYRAKRSGKYTFDVNYTEPNNNKTKPCVIYFHGGGWASCDKRLYRTLCKRIAKLGFVVFNCNYGLAPRNSINQILTDCVDAIDFSRSIAKIYGGDSDKVVLMGDSAGAHISALLAGRIQNNYYPDYKLKGKIKALGLFYGVFNLKTSLTTGFKDMEDYVNAIVELNKPNTESELERYSPVTYLDSSYPPVFIGSGEIDRLHNTQSAEFYKLLKEKNIPVSKIFFEKGQIKGTHGYLVFDRLSTNVSSLVGMENFLQEVFKTKSETDGTIQNRQ